MERWFEVPILQTALFVLRISANNSRACKFILVGRDGQDDDNTQHSNSCTMRCLQNGVQNIEAQKNFAFEPSAVQTSLQNLFSRRAGPNEWKVSEISYLKESNRGAFSVEGPPDRSIAPSGPTQATKFGIPEKQRKISSIPCWPLCTRGLCVSGSPVHESFGSTR